MCMISICFAFYFAVPGTDVLKVLPSSVWLRFSFSMLPKQSFWWDGVVAFFSSVYWSVLSCRPFKTSLVFNVQTFFLQNNITRVVINLLNNENITSVCSLLLMNRSQIKLCRYELQVWPTEGNEPLLGTFQDFKTESVLLLLMFSWSSCGGMSQSCSVWNTRRIIN